MNLNAFVTLFLMTLRDPARTANVLRAQNLPMNARWAILIVAVSLSSMVNWLITRMIPASESGAVALFSEQPLVLAAMQLFAVVLTAALMNGVGRMFGGAGNFPDALLLVTWIEVMLLALQLVQVVLILVLPMGAALIGLIAAILFVGLLVIFTKELHGFTNIWLVGLGFVATVLATAFMLSFIAAAFGLIPGAGAA